MNLPPEMENLLYDINAGQLEWIEDLLQHGKWYSARQEIALLQEQLGELSASTYSAEKLQGTTGSPNRANVNK